MHDLILFYNFLFLDETDVKVEFQHPLLQQDMDAHSLHKGQLSVPGPLSSPASHELRDPNFDLQSTCVGGDRSSGQEAHILAASDKGDSLPVVSQSDNLALGGGQDDSQPAGGL